MSVELGFSNNVLESVGNGVSATFERDWDSWLLDSIILYCVKTQ